MKINLPEPDEDEVISCGVVDARGNEDEALAEVDRLLAKHGLEVVTYDTQSDTIMFAILPRDK